jgi:hypothetical protein
VNQGVLINVFNRENDRDIHCTVDTVRIPFFYFIFHCFIRINIMNDYEYVQLLCNGQVIANPDTYQGDPNACEIQTVFIDLFLVWFGRIHL